MLGDLHEKTEKDETLKDLVKFKFDAKHDMGKYAPLPPPKEDEKKDDEVKSEKSTTFKSKYPPKPADGPPLHEAAYDAYITGVVFTRILKFEEIKSMKNFLEQYN